MPIFLDFGTTALRGSSTEPSHIGWVELDSLSFGAFTAPGQRGGAPSARPRIPDVSASTRDMLAASGILQASLDGTSFKSVRADFVPGEGPTMRITFVDALITSVSIGGGKGGTVPMTNFVLAPAKMESKTLPPAPPPGKGP